MLSAYGCTTKLAQAAYEELKKDPNLDVRLMNVVFTPLAEAAALVNEADALLVGSCTINRDAPKVVWDVFSFCRCHQHQAKACRCLWFLWLER